MKTADKRIVIFGATGTVGAYAALYLKEMGYDVVATGHRKSDSGFFASYGIEYHSYPKRKSSTNFPTKAYLPWCTWLECSLQG